MIPNENGSSSPPPATGNGQPAPQPSPLPHGQGDVNPPEGETAVLPGAQWWNARPTHAPLPTAEVSRPPIPTAGTAAPHHAHSAAATHVDVSSAGPWPAVSSRPHSPLMMSEVSAQQPFQRVRVRGSQSARSFPEEALHQEGFTTMRDRSSSSQAGIPYRTSGRVGYAASSPSGPRVGGIRATPTAGYSPTEASPPRLAGSAVSRPHGNAMPPYRATASKPEWLSAAERVKVRLDANPTVGGAGAGRGAFDSVLPPDQNAGLGLQRTSQRGLTAAQLRGMGEPVGASQSYTGFGQRAFGSMSGGALRVVSSHSGYDGQWSVPSTRPGLQRMVVKEEAYDPNSGFRPYSSGSAQGGRRTTASPVGEKNLRFPSHPARSHSLAEKAQAHYPPGVSVRPAGAVPWWNQAKEPVVSPFGHKATAFNSPRTPVINRSSGDSTFPEPRDASHPPVGVMGMNSSLGGFPHEGSHYSDAFSSPSTTPGYLNKGEEAGASGFFPSGMQSSHMDGYPVKMHNGGGGGGAGGSTPNIPLSDPGGSKRKKKSEMEGVLSEKGKRVVSAPDQEEQNIKQVDVNAIHAIPWEQRSQMPATGFGTRFFALLATPRFWEKMDWTFRGSLLTVVPTMILSLDPTTREYIPVPSMFAFMAFWITKPTFGLGLEEAVCLVKGFMLTAVLLVIMISVIHPGPPWASLLTLFFFTVFGSFVGDSFKKITGYLLTSTMLEYIYHPDDGLRYLLDSYTTIAIALCFGVVAFIIPFIRWSSENARHYTESWGNALSISVQGICSSFWVDRSIERELNYSHLHQLRTTGEMCRKKVETALDESEFEPLTGAFVSKMRTRYEFCLRIHHIMCSMLHLIKLLTDDPGMIDTPTCNSFGALLQEDLAIIVSAMDRMILKIVDFSRPVKKGEIAYFREAHERFQEAVSSVREDVMLNNENYETEASDVYLGFFLFSVRELADVIGQFEDVENPPSGFLHTCLFFLRDLKSVIKHTKRLFVQMYYSRSLTRRAKEAIKLSVCLVVPCLFQFYIMEDTANSPFAGAAVVALIYHGTGAESFHYAVNRLLGTVLGSLISLVAVELSDGVLWKIYIFVVIFSFVGAYVQAAPGFYALGNSIVCSVISIMTQYNDSTAAMTRITQNCFAILSYFLIVSFLWPMRAHTKVRMGLDTSLRCIRECCTSFLRNLDMPDDAAEVTADTSALLKELSTKVKSQARFIPGAVEEPTLGSVEFPERNWWRIVEAEMNLLSTLNMMRVAYRTFMTQRADAGTAISVHWVVLHRISPYASDLADLIHAMIDLHLLQMHRNSVVPIAHLTRLRLAMQDSQKSIIDMYVAALQRKVDGVDDEDGVVHEWSTDLSSERAPLSSWVMDEAAVEQRAKGSVDTSPPLSPAAAPFPRDAAVPPEEGTTRDLKKPTVPEIIIEHKLPERGVVNKSKEDMDVVSLQSHRSKDNPPQAGTCRRKTVCGDEVGKTTRDTKGAPSRPGERKQSGLLTYRLTKEEEMVLRNFLQSRRNRASDDPESSMVSLAPPNPNASNGVSSMVLNEARLAAAGGEAESIVEKLRKKHKVKVARGNGDTGNEEDAKAATNGGENDGEPRSKKERRKEDKMSNNDSESEDDDSGDDDDGNPVEDRSPVKRGTIPISNASFISAKPFLSRLFKNAKIRYKSEDASDTDHTDTEASALNRSMKEGISVEVSDVDFDVTTNQCEAGGDAIAGSRQSSNYFPMSLRGSETAMEGKLGVNKRSPHVKNSFFSPSVMDSLEGDDEDKFLGDESSANVAEKKDEPAYQNLRGPGLDLSSTIHDPSTSQAIFSIPRDQAQKNQVPTPSQPLLQSNSLTEPATAPLKTEANVLSSITSSTGKAECTPLLAKKAAPEGSRLDEYDEEGRDMLNEIEFFDEDRREFVLTNSDIHSLEAFFFGIRALVVFLDDLQRSIINMQHQYNLNKKL